MNEFNFKEIVESREKVAAIDWDYVEIKNSEESKDQNLNKNPNKINVNKKEENRRVPMSDNFLG